MGARVLVVFEDGNQLHDGVDTDPHGVEVEDMRVFLGVDFVETLFEHFGLFHIWFFSSVLAAGEEDVWISPVLPECISSSKMEEMACVSRCCSLPAFFVMVLYIIINIMVLQRNTNTTTSVFQ